MNWDALGAVGEIVGAAAVVVTLIFLTKEMRMNRTTAESNSVDSLTGGLNAMNLEVANNPELAEIWLRGFSDPDSLSDVEHMRFAALGQTLVNQFTTIKKHHDAGTLPQQEWDTYCSGTCQLMSNPGGKWLLDNLAISPDIVALIERFARDVNQSNYLWKNTRENAPNELSA